MPTGRFLINGVPFLERPGSVFQVFDAGNVCVGAWDTLELALAHGLAKHPKGYLVACEEYRGWGMKGQGHFYTEARWASPGPKRTARVPGFAGTPAQARAEVRRRRGRARAVSAE